VTDDIFCEFGFGFDHFVDAFFECASDDVFMDLDSAGLADAVGAVGRLVFYGWVPPAVKVEDMRRGGEIETDTTGFEREEEDWIFAGGFLEGVDHFLALALGGAAVEEEDFFAEFMLEHVGEDVAHLAELGEDECLVAFGDEFVELFEESDTLA